MLLSKIQNQNMTWKKNHSTSHMQSKGRDARQFCRLFKFHHIALLTRRKTGGFQLFATKNVFKMNYRNLLLICKCVL